MQPPDGEDDFHHISYSKSERDRTSLGIGQQGYSSEHKRFLLNGDLQKYDSVAVTQNNENLNIGQLVKDAVGLGRISLVAPDCGNTHEFYAQAKYQNLRYRGVYSQVRSLAVAKQISGLDLGDPVYMYQYDLTTDTTPTVIKTRGIVEAKVKAIRNGFYVERYNITYQGEDAEVLT